MKHAAGIALLLVATLGACHRDGDEGELDLGVTTDAAVPNDSAVGRPDLEPEPDLAPFIDPNGGGGSVDLLQFGVFGDIRPPLPDDVFQYPTTIANAVFAGLAKSSPQFVVGTGDYMYAEFSQSMVDQQVALLTTAEKAVAAPFFHAMGNHECNSVSDLNCPNLNESVNITTYLSTLVPFTKGVPWFDFTIHTSFGDAKFIFIAANGWNDDQAAWLKQALAPTTKYTFVSRHQPSPEPNSAGVTGSDAILANYPVTLWLLGHVHEYKHLTTNSFIAGNAGAPLENGATEYGWCTVKQRADGTIAVTAWSMSTGMPMDSFAVTPDGQMAP